MTTYNSIIADTSELAKVADFDEGSEPRDNLEATANSDPAAKVEFHVQMRSWTLNDMEALIVEAAARQLVGRNASEGALSKAVQEAAIRQITEKADAKLATVSAAIIDQPVMAGPGSKDPVTMRDMIGLYANEYLSAVVDREGKPSQSGGYYGGKARIVWIVERALDSKFKAEIEKATNAAISQIQASVREQHKAVLDAETARIRAAIAMAVQG